MSLRVLLADESPSIKKAFALALQDYGVKIQTVHQGVDVHELFKTFQPDICFMDVLLPKLNGYDACLQLKSADHSKETPVVLMWSGFMELDQRKFASSGASGNIEKPFDTETLRSLVKQLVPKLGQNQISAHLVMDEPPPMVDEDDKTPTSLVTTDPTEAPDLPPFENLDFGSNGNSDVDSLEENIPSLASFESILKEDTDVSEDKFNSPEGLSFDNVSTTTPEDEWSAEPIQGDPFADLAPEGLDDVDSFSVQALDEENLPFETPSEEAFSTPEGFDLPPTPDKVTSAQKTTTKKSVEPLKTEDAPVTPLKDENEIIHKESIPQLSKEELKRLILAQSKDIIESVVWDVVPELAKEMIQKEIQRLTGEIKYESDLR